MIHANSLLAYQFVVGELSVRQRDVFNVVDRLGLVTNVGIARELCVPVHTITGRTGELVRMGWLRVVRDDFPNPAGKGTVMLFGTYKYGIRNYKEVIESGEEK